MSEPKQPCPVNTYKVLPNKRPEIEILRLDGPTRDDHELICVLPPGWPVPRFEEFIEIGGTIYEVKKVIWALGSLEDLLGDELTDQSVEVYVCPVKR